ncbi:MAG: cation transporter [Chloroflexi bacterium]|nr:cation transporter [Chloroflexota bacterium]
MLTSPKAASWLPVISNAVLVALKLSVGLLIGSISMVSDALDSGIDLLVAFVAFAGIRIAARPADAVHPYGHGKVENISGVVEALFILGGAGFIAYQAVNRIISGGDLGLVEVGIGVMAFSVVTNFLVSRHLLRVARRSGSVALEAAGRHRATDVYTSLGVLLGLSAVRVTGIQVLDPIIALAIGGVVVKAGVEIILKSLGGLMDVRLPLEEEAEVRELVESYSHVFTLRDIRTRKGGYQRYIDLTLVTCQNTRVGEADQQCHRLEKDIKERFPHSVVTTHVEPCTMVGNTCPDSCPVRGRGATLKRDSRVG